MQNRQNRCLALYEAVIRNTYGMNQNASQEDMDNQCWPAPDTSSSRPYQRIISQFKSFLAFVALKSVPKSIVHQRISYPVLYANRESLLFWARRKYAERNIEFKEGIVRVELLTFSKYLGVTLKLYRPRSQDTFVGVPELIDLIDQDMRATPCIEIAECHHLAWVLGRTCALRPGMIGRPREGIEDPARSGFPYLTFRDLKITRGKNAGEFNLEILIRNIKSCTVELGEMNRPIKTTYFIIKSPASKHNLMLSVPHRVLAIALRRGALDQINTLDELIGGAQHYIRFKPDFLDTPVLLAGRPRGLSVDPDKALSASSLSAYLQQRGQMAGYKHNISFYSIRRAAGTDFTRLLGPDRARSLMTHDPESRALELFYLDQRPTTDVTALAFRDGPERVDEMEVDSNILTLEKLDATGLANVFGPALNALVRKQANLDERFKSLTKPSEIKNRLRIFRRAAIRTLMAERRADQERTMTKAEMDRRKEEIINKSSEFNKAMVEKARQHARAIDLDDDGTVEEEGVNCDEDFADDPDDSGHGVTGRGEGIAGDTGDHDNDDNNDDSLFVNDVRNEVRVDESGNLVIEVGDENVVDDAAVDEATLVQLSYEEAARATMALLLDNVMNEYKTLALSPCPLCADDDTMPPEAKSKMWSHHKLQRHMAGEVHSKRAQFSRRAEKARIQTGANGLECECCRSAAPEGTALTQFPDNRQLYRHLAVSGDKAIQGNVEAWSSPFAIATHERQKRKIGYYDDDWAGDVQGMATIRRDYKRAKRDQLAKDDPVWSWSKEVELDKPTQVPGVPGVMYGSWGRDLVPAGSRLESVLKFTDQIPNTPVPSHLHSVLHLGPPPTFESLAQRPPIPPRPDIIFVPIPGQPGNLRGEGKRILERIREANK